MDALLTPDQCLPLDFVNPFLPWVQIGVGCALGLLLEPCMLLMLRGRGASTALRSRGWRRAIVLLVASASAAGIGAMVFTVWAETWSANFKPWCISQLYDYLTLQYAESQQVEYWGAIVRDVSFGVLLIGGGMLLVALITKSREQEVERQES
jgi:hypothetical protein